MLAPSSSLGARFGGSLVGAVCAALYVSVHWCPMTTYSRGPSSISMQSIRSEYSTDIPLLFTLWRRSHAHENLGMHQDPKGVSREIKPLYIVALYPQVATLWYLFRLNACVLVRQN